MRIRKHLSGLNLPAVCNPVFRKDPVKSSNNNDNMINKVLVPGGGSSSTAAAGSSSSSQELEVAAAGGAAGQGEKATTRILKCRTGVLKVYSSSSRSLANNTSTSNIINYTNNANNNMNNNEASSATSLLSAAAAAAAAASHNGAASQLVTRPKRTKPNACLVKGSSHTDHCMQQDEFQLEAVEEQKEQVEFRQQFHNNSQLEPDEQQQQHRRAPLVEHIFPVIQDVGSLKQQTTSPASAAAAAAGGPVEVPMQAEEIPIERDLLLPLSKSQSHQERHDDAATRQAQRTRSMRKLDAVDPNNDDVNQCRRRDGKGWRCHRRTQPAYSLCEYHLDKSRETHQRKLRSSGASVGEPKRKYVRRKPVKARSLMSI